jgi:carbon monoxide dehydrogenase subunit G
MSLPFTSSTTANKYHSGAMAVATGITSPTNAGQIQSSHVQPNMNKAFFAGHGSQGMFFSTTSAGFAVANAGTMIMTIKYEAST